MGAAARAHGAAARAQTRNLSLSAPSVKKSKDDHDLWGTARFFTLNIFTYLLIFLKIFNKKDGSL
jgi:hypothetical protein